MPHFKYKYEHNVYNNDTVSVSTFCDMLIAYALMLWFCSGLGGWTNTELSP